MTRSKGISRALVVARATDARPHLERLVMQTSADSRDGDPVGLVHAFGDPADREVVAWIASALAFGNVTSIRARVADVLRRIGPTPAKTVAALTPRAARELARGFVHRWIGAAELASALVALGSLLSEHGSLERAFASDPRSAAAPTVEPVLIAFAEAFARRIAGSRAATRALRFLVPSPAGGAACKRQNLFLRWMVRPADGVDLGQWKALRPAQLLVPLDTHVAFHARVLGFSRRPTADWTMVGEVTAALRLLDADDPVRFDFALCHLGIHGDCRGRRVAVVCAGCPLDAVCRLPAPGKRGSQALPTPRLRQADGLG